MVIKRIWPGVIVLILLATTVLPGCEPTTTTGANALSAGWCQETADKLKALQPGEIPGNLTTGDSSKTGGEFDAEAYFSVLKHLSMEDGYILDWVYHFDGTGGIPVLYTRPVNAVPYKTAEEFERAANTFTRPENDISTVWFVMGDKSGLDGNKIRTDGTREGYFEYAVLQLLGQQFYLFWHSNYNDNRIVCEGAELESVLAGIDGSDLKPVDDGFKNKARKIDLTSTVEISGDTAVVSLVAFSKWGGFSRYEFLIYKDYPHMVIGLDRKILLEYECGMVF